MTNEFLIEPTDYLLNHKGKGLSCLEDGRVEMGRLSMLLKGSFASRAEMLKWKWMSHSKSKVHGRGKRQVAWHSMRSWVLSYWGQRGHLQPKSWNIERVPCSGRVSAWSQIWRGSGRVIKINAMCQRGWTLLADRVWGTGLRLGLGFILKHSCSGRKLQVITWNIFFFLIANISIAIYYWWKLFLAIGILYSNTTDGTNKCTKPWGRGSKAWGRRV